MIKPSLNTEKLDMVIGFLAAMALGLAIVIGVTIVRGTQQAWPSLILLGLVIVIGLLWRRRERLRLSGSDPKNHKVYE